MKPPLLSKLISRAITLSIRTVICEGQAWELANNPHLDPEKTVTDRQVRLDSYYN